MVPCSTDGCSRRYHIGCLRPRLKRLPSTSKAWVCPHCKEREKTGEQNAREAMLKARGLAV